MRFNLFYLLVLFFFSKSVNCQEINLQIIDDSTNQNIATVLIYYNDSLISRTDKNGFAIIKLLQGEIQIVKEGYIDAKHNVENNTVNKIYLKKIASIQLEEVVVKNLNKQTILDSIYVKIYNKKFYNLPEYSHGYNIFQSNNDTLHYLNERLQLVIDNGYFVNIQNRFIKNFEFVEDKKIKNNYAIIYNLNNKKLTFPKVLTTGYIKINFNGEFKDLYTNIKNYNLELTNSGAYSKLVFFPKNRNKKFGFLGYIIFDTNDFGILEFKMELIPNNKNTMFSGILEEKMKQDYQILNEMFHIFNKKINNQYYFINSYSNVAMLQLKGNFKNQIFTKKSYFEDTLPFTLTNKKRLNIISYDLL